MNEKRPAWKKETHKNIVKPLEVVVHNNDIEQAIKELRHKMSKEAVLAEVKIRKAYEKPSVKKRRRHREAIKKLRRSRGKKARQRLLDKKNSE